MAEHARLSASSAKAWLSCGGFIAFQDNYPSDGEESEYAKEGTQAHEYAEIILKRAFYGIDRRIKKTKENADMLFYVDQYVDYVKNIYKDCVKRYGRENVHIRIEQRLDFSHIVPGGFGTGDAVIITPKDIIIIDLKYGLGVSVSAYENPQLKLYGLGALKQYEDFYDSIENVQLHIAQVRLENYSTYEISVDDLNNWSDEVKETTEKIASGDINFYPGIDQCRWCKGNAICKERFTQLFEPIKTILNERISGDDL